MTRLNPRLLPPELPRYNPSGCESSFRRLQGSNQLRPPRQAGASQMQHPFSRLPEEKSVSPQSATFTSSSASDGPNDPAASAQDKHDENVSVEDESIHAVAELREKDVSEFASNSRRHDLLEKKGVDKAIWGKSQVHSTRVDGNGKSATQLSSRSLQLHLEDVSANRVMKTTTTSVSKCPLKQPLPNAQSSRKERALTERLNRIHQYSSRLQEILDLSLKNKTDALKCVSPLSRTSLSSMTLHQISSHPEVKTSTPHRNSFDPKLPLSQTLSPSAVPNPAGYREPRRPAETARSADLYQKTTYVCEPSEIPERSPEGLVKSRLEEVCQFGKPLHGHKSAKAVSDKKVDCDSDKKDCWVSPTTIADVVRVINEAYKPGCEMSAHWEGENVPSFSDFESDGSPEAKAAKAWPRDPESKLYGNDISKICKPIEDVPTQRGDPSSPLSRSETIYDESSFSEQDAMEQQSLEALQDRGKRSRRSCQYSTKPHDGVKCELDNKAPRSQLPVAHAEDHENEYEQHQDEHVSSGMDESDDVIDESEFICLPPQSVSLNSSDDNIGEVPITPCQIKCSRVEDPQRAPDGGELYFERTQNCLDFTVSERDSLSSDQKEYLLMTSTDTTLHTAESHVRDRKFRHTTHEDKIRKPRHTCRSGSKSSALSDSQNREKCHYSCQQTMAGEYNEPKHLIPRLCMKHIDSRYTSSEESGRFVGDMMGGVVKSHREKLIVPSSSDTETESVSGSRIVSQACSSHLTSEKCLSYSGKNALLPNVSSTLSRYFTKNYWKEPESTEFQSLFQTSRTRRTRQKFRLIPSSVLDACAKRWSFISHVEATIFSVENAHHIDKIVVESLGTRLTLPFDCYFLRLPFVSNEQFVTFHFLSSGIPSAESESRRSVTNDSYESKTMRNCNEVSALQTFTKPSATTYYFDLPVKCLLQNELETAAALETAADFNDGLANFEPPHRKFQRLISQAENDRHGIPLVKFHACLRLQGLQSLVVSEPAPRNGDCSPHHGVKFRERVNYVGLFNDPVDKRVARELDRCRDIVDSSRLQVEKINFNSYRINNLLVTISEETITPETHPDFNFKYYQDVTGKDFLRGLFQLPIVQFAGVSQPLIEFLQKTPENSRCLAASHAYNDFFHLIDTYQIPKGIIPDFSLKQFCSTPLPHEALKSPEVVSNLYRHATAIRANLVVIYVAAFKNQVIPLPKMFCIDLLPPLVQINPCTKRLPVTFSWNIENTSEICLLPVPISEGATGGIYYLTPNNHLPPHIKKFYTKINQMHRMETTLPSLKAVDALMHQRCQCQLDYQCEPALQRERENQQLALLSQAISYDADSQSLRGDSRIILPTSEFTDLPNDSTNLFDPQQICHAFAMSTPGRARGERVYEDETWHDTMRHQAPSTARSRPAQRIVSKLPDSKHFLFPTKPEAEAISKCEYHSNADRKHLLAPTCASPTVTSFNNTSPLDSTRFLQRASILESHHADNTSSCFSPTIASESPFCVNREMYEPGADLSIEVLKGDKISSSMEFQSGVQDRRILEFSDASPFAQGRGDRMPETAGDIRDQLTTNYRLGTPRNGWRERRRASVRAAQPDSTGQTSGDPRAEFKFVHNLEAFQIPFDIVNVIQSQNARPRKSL